VQSPAPLPEPEPSPKTDGPGPRRFLLATGVSHYPGLHNRDLPTVEQDLKQVVELFTTTLGYQHVPAPGPNPTAEELRFGLEDFARDPDRRGEDLVVVYYVGHGEILDDGRHVLLLPDSTRTRTTDINTAELARWLLTRTRVRRLLVILETCYSGQGADDLAVRAFKQLTHASLGHADEQDQAVVLLTATRPKQQAQPGVFAGALVRAVGSRAVAGNVPPGLHLHALIRQLTKDPQVPKAQRPRLHELAREGDLPPFLRNPRRDPALEELDLLTQLQVEQGQLRRTELAEHFGPRGRGVERATEVGWWFQGRHHALRTLADWLKDLEADWRIRVVTGDPGSGKSALLGQLYLLADPSQRPRVPLRQVPAGVLPPLGAINVAIHARGKTPADLLAALGAAAGVRAERLSDLLGALQSRKQPLVALIDALDEAADPRGLVEQVLRPLLAQTSGYPIRLLLGTRRHVLDWLGISPERFRLVDLDLPPYLEPRDLLGFITRGLRELAPTSPYRQAPLRLVDQTAQAVAEAAGHSFLVARISTRTLAATVTLPNPNDPAWRRGLPTTAGEAMGRDLNQRLHAEDTQRARDLLLPLAYAEGAGIPWEDIWAPLATQLARQRDPTASYTDQDLEWLREHAGSYVIEASEQGRSAYRLYHQALADHLRQALPDAHAHQVIARFLVTHTPTRPGGGVDWAHAHPYTRRHLASHAASGDPDLLDELLIDPEFLLAAEPSRLLSASDQARSPDAKAASVAYQHTVHHLRGKSPDEHAAYLELAAHCYHAGSLVERIRQASPPQPWTVRWAQWNPQVARLTLTGHTDNVTAVAVGELDGRPIAVSGSRDRTLRLWDLASGTPIGQPLTGHTDGVLVVAVAEWDGRPIVVSGGCDQMLRLWDLAAGVPIGQPLTGHTGWVLAVALAELDGRRIVVSADIQALRLWDLATGTPIGQPLTGHTGGPLAVAVAELDGRAVAVSGGMDRTLRLWDVAAGVPIGQPLTGHTGRVLVVAVAELDGRRIVVSADTQALRLWDLDSGAPIGEPLTTRDRFGGVTAVAVGELDGHPIAVSGGEKLRLWDLATGIGRPISVERPFLGFTEWVRAVAVGELDGRPIAVSGGGEELRLWDLATGTLAGEPLTNRRHAGEVTAVAVAELDGRAIAVTGGTDQALCLWDLATLDLIDQPLRGHLGKISAVAVGELDGRPIAISGSHDGTVRRWNLSGFGNPRVRPHRFWRNSSKVVSSQFGQVASVACGEVGRMPVVASGGDDHIVHLHRLADALPLRDLILDAPITALVMAPPNLLVVGTTQGLVVVALDPFHTPTEGSGQPIGSIGQGRR
jgi:WD40 repeat protein